MEIWAKHGVAGSTASADGLRNLIRLPHVKFGSTWANFAMSSDWTPNSSDVKVSKDGGAFASIGTNPDYVNGAWQYVLSSAELEAKIVDVRIVDEATKGILDDWIKVFTYGHSSAFMAADLSDKVRLGLTALPNADAGASSGLVVGDSSGLVRGISGTKRTFDALNDVSAADVSSAVSSQLRAIGLDHLLNAAAGSSEAVIGSIFARLAASGSSGKWSDFLSSSHALQALRSAMFSSAGLSTLKSSQVSDALSSQVIVYGLDHLLSAAAGSSEAVVGSIFARLAASGSSGKWGDFISSSHALQAIAGKAGVTAAGVWGFSSKALSSSGLASISTPTLNLFSNNIWANSTRALTDKAGFALSSSGRDALWRDARIAAPSTHLATSSGAQPEKVLGWLTALNLDRLENNSSQMTLYKHGASSAAVAKAALAFSTSSALAQRGAWSS